MKKAKQWNTLITNWRLESKGGGTYNPPMFARAYNLTTTPESNSQGSWFGWAVKAAEVISELPHGMEIYGAAKGLREQVQSGEVKVSAQVEDAAGATESDDDPM